MVLDLFISDGNDLGWNLVLIAPIGVLVLLVWLGWLVFTPPKPKDVASDKHANWVWALLCLLVLVVLGFYIL